MTRPAAYIDIHVTPDNHVPRPHGPGINRAPCADFTLWRPGGEQAGNLMIHTGAPMLLGYHGIATVARIRPRCARGRHGVRGWALVMLEGKYNDLRVLIFRRRAQAIRWARQTLLPLRWEDDAPTEWANIGTITARRPGILLTAEREAWARRTPGAYTGPSGAIRFTTDEDAT